jgi:hypothetical protein
MDCIRNSGGKMGKAYRIVIEKYLILAFSWMTKKVWDSVKMSTDILGIVCEVSIIITVWFGFGSESFETLGFSFD